MNKSGKSKIAAALMGTLIFGANNSSAMDALKIIGGVGLAGEFVHSIFGCTNSKWGGYSVGRLAKNCFKKNWSSDQSVSNVLEADLNEQSNNYIPEVKLGGQDSKIYDTTRIRDEFVQPETSKCGECEDVISFNQGGSLLDLDALRKQKEDEKKLTNRQLIQKKASEFDKKFNTDFIQKNALYFYDTVFKDLEEFTNHYHDEELREAHKPFFKMCRNEEKLKDFRAFCINEGTDEKGPYFYLFEFIVGDSGFVVRSKKDNFYKVFIMKKYSSHMYDSMRLLSYTNMKAYNGVFKRLYKRYGFKYSDGLLEIKDRNGNIAKFRNGIMENYDELYVKDAIKKAAIKNNSN